MKYFLASLVGLILSFSAYSEVPVPANNNNGYSVNYPIATVSGYPVFGDIRDWGYMLQAQGAYILEISIARVYAAEAALKEARTLHLDTQVAMLAEFVRRLRLEMRTLEIRQREITARQRTINRSAQQINLLKLGKTSKTSLGAIRQLYLYDAVSAQIIGEAEQIEIEAIADDDFIPNKIGGGTEDFAGGNVADLLEFLETHDLSIRRGSKARFALLAFISKIEEEARKRMEELERLRQSLRDGTLDIFRPPSTDGLISSYPDTAVPGAVPVVPFPVPNNGNNNNGNGIPR